MSEQRQKAIDIPSIASNHNFSTVEKSPVIAVRARIDWKYALSLPPSDPGFDYSVLSEFRDRLIAGKAEQLLLAITPTKQKLK